MSTGPPGETDIRPQGAPRLSLEMTGGGRCGAASADCAAIKANPAMPISARRRAEPKGVANPVTSSSSFQRPDHTVAAGIACHPAIEPAVNPATPKPELFCVEDVAASMRPSIAAGQVAIMKAVLMQMPSPLALAALTSAAVEWSADPAVLAPLLVDWRGRFHGASPILLQPRTTEAVAAIVRAAATHRVALVPQGGNTGLVGGAIPAADGSAVLLSLAWMNRIRAVDPAGLTLTAEAGVILAQVHDAARAVACEFPLSLAAKGSATIGGLVSTNAGGVQVLRHGTMRALVVGLEAVLPSGDILNQLTGLAKDNTGYDVKQLLIGAEGTLGIVTAAALRLVPAPAHRAVAWAGVSDPHAALALLARLRLASGNQVESFELIPGIGLQLVLDHVPACRPPLAGKHPWHVLVELAGPHSLDDVLVASLAEAVAAGEVTDAVVAASTAQAAALWRLREGLPEAERRDGPAVHHDVAVAVADMPGFALAATAQVEAAFPGARVIAFGHLGDGNLHFNVRAPAGPAAAAAAWLAPRRKAITAQVHDLVSAAGGSISAEHGIGMLKRDELARLGDPGKLAAMRAIKSALDPLNLMNPGKML
jgi:FAD/FMN-containing dehydrogenase